MSLTKFEGIPVWFCFPGSPAERAGVRQGDRLLVVNGMQMANAFDYVTARGLDSRRISLTLLRGNRIHDLTVELDGSYSITPEELGAGEDADSEPAASA